MFHQGYLQTHLMVIQFQQVMMDMHLIQQECLQSQHINQLSKSLICYFPNTPGMWRADPC